MSEQVLVFPADLIDGFKQDAPSGILTDPKKISHYLENAVYSDHTTFIDRAAAETDPSYKQIIPYVVFEQPGKVFVYQRTTKGGEDRLHSKWSLGVGGHINPTDTQSADHKRTYWNALAREIREEVSFISQASQKGEYPIVALLYDDSNDVGKVHFGVVHRYMVPTGTAIASNDAALQRGHWVPIENLSDSSLNFEGWSKLVIEGVY